MRCDRGGRRRALRQQVVTTVDASGLIELCESSWYDTAVSMLRRRLEGGDKDPAIVTAHRLAGVAKRVLALDAEDFHLLARQNRDQPWSGRLASCGFPHEPRDRQRGALGSLVPLFELMLEVINLRAVRGENQDLVVAAHLLGEYQCQLAWESRLGHAGDPLRLPDAVGQRWGTDDEDCSHNSVMRATARRALHAAGGDVVGFTSYLDKFYSRLGETLAVCAMNHETIRAGARPDVGQTCRKPCRWVLAGGIGERRDLDARVRLALIYLDSPLVALRHHAPVGHFFGVPSPEEISEGWLRTWEKLSQQWPDRTNPLVGQSMATADEALPGLTALVSAIAGRPIVAGTLLHDIGRDIIAALASARS